MVHVVSMAAAGQHAAQIANRREHFVVPVRALRIVGPLLVLDDFLVLAKNILGEPGYERPHRMDDAGHARLS